MDNFYIYQYCEDVSESYNFTLVIFCAGETIDEIILKDKLREFFRTHAPPKNIYVLAGDYQTKTIEKIFSKNQTNFFDVIPNYIIKDGKIKIIYFNSSGILTLNNNTFEDSSLLIQTGIFNIFKLRGGLIEAPSETYHYVFPSGKHSTSFIRAGNVLVHGAEITFIALALLKWARPNLTHIYCDTSSINSLAYALIELKKRFTSGWVSPTIISFGSYEKFENFDFKDSKNSLIIISASTSGRITKRLQEKHRNLKKENIILLFYLSRDIKDFNTVCDLTYNEKSFPSGLLSNKMFENEVDCEYCNSGSYTVRITGDIFLLEKPKVKTVTINKADAPAFLSKFMEKFHARAGVNFVRCFFGEDQARTFEVFFKADDLLKNKQKLSKNFLFAEEFQKKFNKILQQHVPSQLKEIIYLNDTGSKLIAEHIRDHCAIPANVRIVSSKEFVNDSNTNTESGGSIFVVCSSLVTGNNFLYVNKYLRRFHNMTKTFFVMFARTESDQHLEFIKKNIGQGEFGINTNNFLIIERITCSQLSEINNTHPTLSWSREINLLRKLISLIEEKGQYTGAKKYLEHRLSTLLESQGKEKGGLVNNVFLANPINRKSLAINKNFAFFDFDGYHGKVSQADIYFTISTILNQLRNGDAKKRKIVQEEQIRTLIDPDNFIRYDDGIIQAAILRSATQDELNYRISLQHSNLLSIQIKKMVENSNDSLSSEALIEFLFAIAIKKLRLTDSHLEGIVQIIDRKIKNPVVLAFSAFIKIELKLKIVDL